MSRYFPHIIPLLFLALTVLSCDESLPVRSDPSILFNSKVLALYVISRVDNSLKVYLSLVHQFDETLEGDAHFQGTVTVYWVNDTSVHKTFQPTPSAIDRGGHYNSATNTLTLDPGDTLRLGFSWDFTADDGSSLFSKVVFHKDPSCQQRMVSDSLAFFVRSQVKMFEKTSTSVAPTIVYRFQLHQAFIADQFCTPL